MKKEFPFLQKALEGNLELKDVVFDYYRTEYLTILDKLLGDLFNSSCKGMDVKIAETSPDLVRFQALISELEFARYFVNNKMQVELLSNDAFEGRKAQDIYATNNSKEYFVEVKNIQQDEMDYIYGTKIAETLNSRGLSFIVIVKSLHYLSTPSYLYQTRREKEKFLDFALQEFIDKLENIQISSLSIAISTDYADIELHKTKKSKSYLGVFTMKEAIKEPSDYKERIRYDVLQKAQKREDWLGEELEKYYIVAIDDDSLFFYVDRYNMELFGHATTYLGEVPKTVISSEIKQALKNSWEQYLRKMCVIRSNRTVIPEDRRGLFFTDPLTKNISAVLVKHRKAFYLLGNPFAEERINNSNILTELQNCLIGWET